MKNDRNGTLLDTYTKVYSEMTGSHPRMLNYTGFGDIESISINEFVSP